MPSPAPRTSPQDEARPPQGARLLPHPQNFLSNNCRRWATATSLSPCCVLLSFNHFCLHTRQRAAQACSIFSGYRTHAFPGRQQLPSQTPKHAAALSGDSSLVPGSCGNRRPRAPLWLVQELQAAGLRMVAPGAAFPGSAMKPVWRMHSRAQLVTAGTTHTHTLIQSCRNCFDLTPAASRNADQSDPVGAASFQHPPQILRGFPSTQSMSKRCTRPR